jgi:predicted lipid carrier protein YhbT
MPPLPPFLSLLPAYPPSALLSILLNIFGSTLLAATERAQLQGKVVCVHVRDAGLRLKVRISSTGYTACATATQADVTISAAASDFVQLALRNADPDTLFFDRRLGITGQTEVGLTVKNALDRIELPLPPAALDLIRKLTNVRARQS